GGEAGDGGELPLERGRHRRGHGLGARAGQTRAHEQRREVDVGEVAHREAAIGDRTDEEHRQHDQRGRHRTADAGGGDAHTSSFALGKIAFRSTVPLAVSTVLLMKLSVPTTGWSESAGRKASTGSSPPAMRARISSSSCCGTAYST